MKKIVSHIAIGLLLITVTLLTALAVAHAGPIPGLWIEEDTQVDGVTLRKVRDTTNGDYNVCYLASRRPDVGSKSPPSAFTVSISCVAEKHP
jgi:hypothetical protein